MKKLLTAFLLVLLSLVAPLALTPLPTLAAASSNSIKAEAGTRSQARPRVRALNFGVIEMARAALKACDGEN